MTPAEIKQWQDEHGGPGSEPEGPDANGITTYRAADGSYINVRRDGSLAMRGFAPSGGPASPPSEPASSTPTGGRVDQQAVLAQLATIAPGGDPSKLEYVESTEPRKITKVPPGGIDPVEMTVSMPVRTWYDPATGRAMKFDVAEDGAFTRTFSGIDPTLKRQGADSQATTPRVEGTPLPGGGFDNNQPIMVNRDAQGRQVGPARALTAPERAQWEKDTGRQESSSDSKPLDGYPGWTTKITKVGNDTKTVFVNPQGQEATDPRPAAGTTKTIVGGDGRTYAQKFDASGAPVGEPQPINVPPETKTLTVDGTLYERQADGSWKPAAGIPNPNAAGAAPGPAMPEVVAGLSERALIDYHRALAADPTLTPQQRKDRFAELVQVATLANNEAVVRQREQESARSAQVNVATTKLNFMQNGLDGALKFVMGFNSKLPQGSDAGAKAFGALMSINAIQLAMSGINDVKTGATIVPPVLPPGTPAPPAVTNPANPKDVDTARAALDTHPAASPQSVATSTAGERTTPPMQAQNPPPTPGEPGVPPLASGPTYQPPAPATVPIPSTLPPADEFGRTPSSGGATATPSPSPAAVDANQLGQPGDPRLDQYVPLSPNYGASGMSVLPDPTTTPPVAPLPPNEVTRVQPSDLGILGKYMPSPQSVQPAFSPSGPDFGPSPDDHPAVLHTIAATTPPWRIDPITLEKMRRAGIPDETIMSVPRRSVA